MIMVLFFLFFSLSFFFSLLYIGLYYSGLAHICLFMGGCYFFFLSFRICSYKILPAFFLGAASVYLTIFFF